MDCYVFVNCWYLTLCFVVCYSTDGLLCVCQLTDPCVLVPMCCSHDKDCTSLKCDKGYCAKAKKPKKVKG